jgi:DNA-binding response OmpR family regulator
VGSENVGWVTPGHREGEQAMSQNEARRSPRPETHEKRSIRLLMLQWNDGAEGRLPRLLSKYGYSVEVVREASAVRANAVDQAFVTIILETGDAAESMPDLCATLRDEGVETPILLLAKGDAIYEVVACLRAGASDFIVDPPEPDTLLARLRWLRNRSQVTESVCVSYEP